MSDYIVTSRILTDEERIILFGKEMSTKFTAIKCLDIENYLGIFEALYTGQTITIPGLEETKGFSRVYIYYDLPAGSRYFYELGHSRNDIRKLFGDVPKDYVKYHLNSFLLPLIKPVKEVFPNIVFNNASNIHTAISSSYDGFIEAISASCFLNFYDGKCISITTYPAIKQFVSNTTPSQLSTLQAAETADSILDAWYYSHFLIPKEIGQVLLQDVPVDNLQVFITNEYKTFSDKSHGIFSWCDAFAKELSFVVAPNYLKYNGYYNINNKPYLGINRNKTPFNAYSGPVSALSDAFDAYLFGSNIVVSTTQNLFEFTGNYASNRYGNNNGSFILVNTEKTNNSEFLKCSGIPELFYLDKEFIETISENIKEGFENSPDLTKTNREAQLKIKKTEFAIKREGSQALSEVENSRYITVQSTDGKLFALTKTSKAKEAARKTAITRKITTMLTPVINLVTQIFASTDFETGIPENYLKFPVSCEASYGMTSKVFNSMSAVAASFDKQILFAEASYKETNARVSNDVVTNLYTKLVTNDNPFTSWIPKNMTNYRAYNFVGLSAKDQETYALSCGMFAYMNHFNSLISLYSPASNQLNFVLLAQNIYKNIALSKLLPQEFAFLKTNGYSYRTGYLTGRQLHFIYSNNFIGTDEEVNKQIENNKNSDYYSINSAQILASTAFTFSSEALDVINKLKKCKTFTDYYNWLKEAKIEVVNRLNNTLFKDDDITRKVITLFLNHYENLLENLSIKETPFLPKEEKKKSKKKEIETTEETDDEIVSLSEDTPTQEQQKQILALLSGEVK